MKLSQAGIDLVKHWEQLRLDAYPDPATGGEPWTIGYGHTGGVRKGQRITEGEAVALLEQDLTRAAKPIRAALHRDVTDNQFSAVVSLCFNCGPAIASSTLVELLNRGEIQAAADQFPRWDHADGKVMPGLLRRREAERTLFLTPDGYSGQEGIEKGEQLDDHGDRIYDRRGPA